MRRYASGSGIEEGERMRAGMRAFVLLGAAAVGCLQARPGFCDETLTRRWMVHVTSGVLRGVDAGAPDALPIPPMAVIGQSGTDVWAGALDVLNGKTLWQKTLVKGVGYSVRRVGTGNSHRYYFLASAFPDNTCWVSKWTGTLAPQSAAWALELKDCYAGSSQNPERDPGPVLKVQNAGTPYEALLIGARPMVAGSTYPSAGLLLARLRAGDGALISSSVYVQTSSFTVETTTCDAQVPPVCSTYPAVSVATEPASFHNLAGIDALGASLIIAESTTSVYALYESTYGLLRASAALDWTGASPDGRRQSVYYSNALDKAVFGGQTQEGIWMGRPDAMTGAIVSTRVFSSTTPGSIAGGHLHDMTILGRSTCGGLCVPGSIFVAGKGPEGNAYIGHHKAVQQSDWGVFVSSLADSDASDAHAIDWTASGIPLIAVAGKSLNAGFPRAWAAVYQCSFCGGSFIVPPNLDCSKIRDAAFPNPFYPRKEGLVIVYDLPQNVYSQLSVFGPDGSEVLATPVFASYAGTNQYAWNGRDRTGQFVLPGTYDIVFKSCTQKECRPVDDEGTRMIVCPALLRVGVR
jgi:hypothetical protein